MRTFFGLAILTLLLGACDFNSQEDYNPKAEFQKFVETQAMEQQAMAQDKGKAAAPDPLAAAKKDFNLYCASCHGADGKAATPTASALNPKPRNFTDAAWQKSVDDAHIAKVIKEGGAAVGLSPTMAPWGAALSDDKIADLVKYVRSFNPEKK